MLNKVMHFVLYVFYFFILEGSFFKKIVNAPLTESVKYELQLKIEGNKKWLLKNVNK